MTARVLTAALILSLAVASASRAEETARVQELADVVVTEAAVRAHALARAPAAPAVAPPAGDPLLADLNDLAVQLLTMSRAIETRGGPEDLRCIFRGMGRDVAVQINALEAAPDRAAQSRVYRAIETLARQAGEIAEDPDAQDVDVSYRTCDVDGN